MQRSAAFKIEWANITTTLGLRGQTAASLLAFKKRNEDARRKVNLLQAQPKTIDFAHYRATLKNQAVIDEIEHSYKAFKPVTVDVGKQLKAIEAFEAQAVLNAVATKDKVDAELEDLHKTLKNIEEARPFEDLTVVRIILGDRTGGGMEGWVFMYLGERREDLPWSSILDITRYEGPAVFSALPFRTHLYLHPAALPPLFPLHSAAMF